MYGRRSGGGIGRFFKNAIIGIVCAGVILALLRMFNYDPFGIIDWAWNWIVHIVNKIATWLTGNEAFRKATKSPSVIFPWFLS